MERTHKCPKCQRELPLTPENFHRNNRIARGFHSYCRTCRNEARKNWSDGDKEKRRLECKFRKRERSYALRMRILSHYGGTPPRCACCGETRYEFMAIDHVNGGGSKHSKSISSNREGLYRWIVNNNFPPMFRVLCHNCNMAIGFYGECPHQWERGLESG